jgi:hypothetical protein
LARNANNQPSAGSGNKGGAVQSPLDGSFPARIVQVIFLGVQEQRAFQGQAKPPIDQVRVTYELSHEFMKDEDGNVLADKPRWYSEQFPFHNADSDLATSTKRYKAYCPSVTSPTDHVWGDNLLGLPVQLILKSRKVEQGKHAGKVFTDIKGVSPAANMPGYVQPELVNPSTFFDPADDDVSTEVFNSLPDWLQDIIKEAKDYGSSALAAKLAGGSSQTPPAPTPPPAPQPAPAPAPQADPGIDGDNPY